MNTIEDIDAILQTPKYLAGIVDMSAWTSEGDDYVAKMTVTPHEGIIVKGLELVLRRKITGEYENGSAVFQLNEQIIQRAHFFPRKDHNHNWNDLIPVSYRGTKLESRKHRLYPWNLNRRWPRIKGDNLLTAIYAPGDFRNFGEFVEMFIKICNIQGYIEYPEFTRRLI